MVGWALTILLTTGSLFALIGLRQFFIDPLPEGPLSIPNLIWFTVQIVPLLIPLVGTLRRNIRATFFLCMASLLYFTRGVVTAYEGVFREIGIFEIVFALGLCAATTIFLRRLREQAAQSSEDYNERP